MSGNSEFMNRSFPTMVGVHATYEKGKYETEFLDDYFVVDIDNKQMEYVNKGDSSENKKAQTFCNLIKRILSGKNFETNQLSCSIKKLAMNLSKMKDECLSPHQKES